jgi:acyl carrier protein
MFLEVGMTREDVSKKIIGVISDILSIDKKMIRHDSHLVEDLGCDSFNAVEILLTLQDYFNIKIPQAAVAQVSTVGDIIDYMVKKTGRK